MFSDHRIATMEEYLRKLSGQEREPLGVTCDHNYVKPWHAHTDSLRTKPAKLLFMNAVHRQKSAYIYPDEEIDVVNVPPAEDPAPPPIFDSQKTRVLANEMERSLRCNLNIDADNSELENFPVENCSFQKKKMYREVMELINAEILAKVVYSGQPHGFIKRKITTDRCAKELRNIFASTFYDFDTILWIHGLILDKGNLISISSYLNILQALGTKIPSFVDKILKSYSGPLGYEYLCQILKKQWDPILPVLNKHKPRKLPGNPFLIMNCAGFNLSKATDKSSRFNSWTANLNALCKTFYIPMDYDNKITYEDVLDDAILNLTKKISESKNHFPKRPVILAGWNIGALIACHVALETAVDAVICFGFPFTGVNGSRGDLNDPILDSNVPTLFIIGQNSNMCSTDDIEDFRSHMRVESGLIIVGGADDFLRISPQKMLLEGITQEIVDRCILEEISEFLQSTLVNMPISNRGFVFNRHVDDIYHKELYKQKRKNYRQYSLEKSSARKHMKVSKETTDVSIKSNLSGIPKKSQQDISKKVKSSPVTVEERRSPIKKLRIKIPKPPVKDSESNSTIPKAKTEISKLAYNTYYSEDPAAMLSTRKSEISFALNILPKKNETVDVEKAFGNDCSFLPRPLSPELDVPIIAAKDQNPGKEFIEPSFATSECLQSHTADITSLGPEIVSTILDSSVPSLEAPSSHILESNGAPKSVENIAVNVASDSNKGVAIFTAPPSFSAGVIENATLTSKPVSIINNMGGEKSVPLMSQATSSGSTKSIITVPSNAATLLVSGQTYKISSGKFLQLLSKGPVSLKSKNTVIPAVVKSAETTSQLLGTNVVASEHPTNIPKKIVAGPTATYMKLASPNISQNCKPLLDLKASQASTASARMETPAELAEKRLAIQALNNSLQLDSVTSATRVNEEPGYSICYAKPDGSIISRKVIRPPIRTTVRPSPHTSFL